MKINSTNCFTLLTLFSGFWCVVDASKGRNELSYCGRRECTTKALYTMAGGYSCGDRIKFLIQKRNLNYLDACARVGGEFPAECGVCSPRKEDHEEEAREFYCGCETCTQEVWERLDPSCGDRITYLTDVLRKSTREACTLVAGSESPQECGPCNPQQCSKQAASSVVELTAMESAEQFSIAAAQEQHNRDDGHTKTTLHARTDLYCFPHYKERTRWRNVWGRYTVEVKEDDGVCGPGNNKFTANTVSLIEGRSIKERAIKLQFKKVGGSWEASEVRVRLPEDQMPFKYGRFSFSVGSVKVIDTNTGAVISKVLPPSLVLGLFTWDDTESFAAKENMNHEVDIEISRWNIQKNADLQFLVQPPGNPQKARFFSGPGNTYQQAPRTFDFDWRPAEIEWHGDRGEHHLYSAKNAIDAGAKDFTQCLPADVEVRMNLWNLFGTGRPTEMEDHHMVEVVIDGFSFRPNGLTEVEDGGACTKDCQCGASATCVSNRCQSSNRNLRLEPIEIGDSMNKRNSTLNLRSRSTRVDDDHGVAGEFGR